MMRPVVRRFSPLFTLVLCAGCTHGATATLPITSVASSQGASRAIAATAPTNVPSSAPTAPEIVDDSIARTRIHILTELDKFTAVPGSSPQLRRLMVGNTRVEITPDNVVTLCDQRTASSFVGAARGSDGRWIFLTHDGLLTASDSFLGPLRRVGETNVHIHSAYNVHSGAGVLTFTDQFSQAWVGTAQGLRRWPEHPVSKSLFANVTTGAFIDVVGGLWVTTDGGNTQHSIALRGEVVGDLIPQNDRLIVKTTAGHFRIEPDNSLSSVPAPPDPMQSQERSDSQRRAVVAAILRKWPANVWSLCPGQLQSDTPTCALGTSIVHLHARTGEILSEEPQPLPTHRCTARAWGERTLIDCRDAQASLRSATGPEVPLGFSPDRLVWDTAGQFAVFPGRCATLQRDTYDEASSRFCLVSGHSMALVEQRTATQNALIDGVYGSVVLAHTSGVAGPLSLHDVRTQRASALSFAEGEQRFVRTVRSAGIASDGTPWAFLWEQSLSNSSTDGHLTVARWAHGSQQAPVYPVADGIENGVFRSQLEAIGFGTTLDGLQRSVDGGQHWQPLPMPIDGSAKSQDLDLYTATCAGRRCLIGTSLLIEGFGPIDSSQRQWLAAQSQVATSHHHAGDREQVVSANGTVLYALRNQLRCTLAAARSDTVSLPGLDAPARANITATVTASDPPTLSLAGTWTVAGSTEPIAIQAGVVPPPSWPVSIAPDGERQWTVPYATSLWAYIARCDRYDQCEHFIVSRDAPPSWLPLRNHSGTEDVRGRLLGAQMVGPNTHALWFRLGGWESGMLNSLLLLRTDGTVAAQRLYFSQGDGGWSYDSSLLMKDNVLGLVDSPSRQYRSAELSAHFYALLDGTQVVSTRPEPMNQALIHDDSPTRLLEPCSSGGGTATATLLGAWVDNVPWFQVPTIATSYASLQLSAQLSSNGQWCVRSVHSLPELRVATVRRQSVLQVAPSLSVVSGAGPDAATALQGVYRHARGSQSLRCRLVAQ